MLIFPTLFFAYVVILNFLNKKPLVFSLVSGYITLLSISVFIAEITSIFSAYNIIWVSVLWTALLAILFFKFPINFKNLSYNLRFTVFEKVLLILMAMIVGICVFKAIFYPPGLPTDSMVYHLPRTFMYYKTESIHNFPANYGHLLFLAPLNAILMSQVQILSFGSDVFLNLLQSTAFIFGAITTCGIAQALGAKRKYALISGFFYVTLSMNILQSSTTQNDLLLSTLCLIAVYYMIVIANANTAVKNNVISYIYLGFSCGLSVLAKLNAGTVLIFFVIAFSIYSIYKKQFSGLIITLAGALSIVMGYWIRNFMSLDGDFLALNYFSFSDLSMFTFQDRIFMSLKNLISLFRAPYLWEYDISGIMEALAQILGSSGVPIPFDYSNISSDNVTYPIQAAMVLVVVAYFIFKNSKVRVYGLLCVSAIIITSFSVQYTASTARYLLPVVSLAIPMIGLFFEKINVKYKPLKSVSIVCMVGSLIFSLFIISNDIYTGFTSDYNNFYTYEYSERLVSYKHNIDINNLHKSILDDIEQNNYTDIAIDDNHPGGAYIWMEPFSSTEYNISFINAQYTKEKEPTDYTPDCIIASLLIKDVKEHIWYNGSKYEWTMGKLPAFGNEIIEDDPIYSRTFNYYVKVLD